MNRIIIFIIGFFICFSLLTVFYFTEKRNNADKKDLLDSKTHPLLWEICNQVFFQTKNFPENINEIISIFKEEGIPEDGINEVFVDPFNRNQGYFYYIPLYNRKNQNREGYLLLSAGIDGKINNVFNDSIYIDEKITMNLYSSDSCFHIFQKWFGKKDLLIYMVNGREMLIKNAGYPYASAIKTLDEITEMAKNVRKRSYFVMGEEMVSFHLMYKGKIMYKDSSSIFFYHNDVWIRNQAYDTFDYKHLNVGDSVMLTGGLTGWENDSIINIKNCITVDEAEIVFDLNEK